MPSFASTGLRVLVVVLASTWTACDGDDDPGTDSGAGTDAGMTGGMDAGEGPPDAGGDDAGTDEDAGPIDVDAGEPGDDAGEPGDDAGPEPVGGGAATSAQIAAVLAAPAGAADLPIEGAVVTYVQPAIGFDPAGFFLQAEPMGPAVFVEIDPAALDPVAQVGQVVDLRATDLSEIDTNQGRREIVAIAGWSVASSGHDVGFLVQDVSAIDIVAMLDDYALEVITTTFEIRGLYRFAGEAHQQISIDTPGATGSDALSLRVPDTLVDAIALEPNCEYRVSGTPLWRLDDSAQVTAFRAAEVALVSCDPPRPTVADARNERSIVVRFDRILDPTSVMADGSQFTVVSSGATAIPVTAAVGFDTYVILTTSADLVSGDFYTLTVATSVLDTQGTGVPAGSMLMLDGYTPHLVINEIDYDQESTDTTEFVEIHNPGLTPLALTGVTLYAIDVSAADVATIDAMVDLVPNSESLTELPAGGYLIVLTESSGSLTVPGGTPTVMLAASLENAVEGVVVSSATMCHDVVYYEGVPLTPEVITGCGVEGAAGTDAGALSLARVPDGADFDETPLDFVLAAPTPGAASTP